MALSEDKKSAAVTDEKGVVVKIRPNSGHFDVRLPNGWGNWKDSMDAAVDSAVRLCFDYRKQVTEEQAYQEMFDYVANCEDGS